MNQTVEVGKLREVTDEDGVSHGEGLRDVAVEMLGKVAVFCSARGNQVAFLACSSWLPDAKVDMPEKTALEVTQKQLLEDQAIALRAGASKDAAYYELAAFCVGARL